MSINTGGLKVTDGMSVQQGGLTSRMVLRSIVMVEGHRRYDLMARTDGHPFYVTVGIAIVDRGAI